MEVVLDNLRSTYNVGSIFRTADAAGITRIYLSGITPGPIDRFGRTNDKLAKVALGAEKTVSWEHAVKTTALLDRLKKSGYLILALEQHAKARKLFDPKVHSKIHRAKNIALVVGPEIKGLSPAILKRADLILEIPMHGKKESLNVSVAFGIAVYTIANSP